ncbi:AEC family transporter [Bacteroides caecigallinarum]|uniref:AEC family transporter n=1 Tax=Bacteroides caecigallinarum TaxID=1411144 RepID=UPI001F40D3AA|nr:AEC family transporter [Bacteroides caecigallinarum]
MDAIVTQMIILFILVIIGYFLNKKKMMGADFDRKLSGLVINVTCPSLILSSVMGDALPDKELIVPLLLVGFATYVVLIGAAFLLPRYLPVKLSERGIYSFMLAFGNVGFIGYPIVASIFGSSAVFYASILNFPSTLLVFVFGTLFIAGSQEKMQFDWRTLYCPAMIASYLSIIIVVTGWIPPRVISTPLHFARQYYCACSFAYHRFFHSTGTYSSNVRQSCHLHDVFPTLVLGPSPDTVSLAAL